MFLRLFRHQLSIRSYGTIPDRHLVYTVDLLKEKAKGYLAENDTAQASEKSFQACKLALMEYVKKLETATDVQIIPDHLINPWNYKAFNKLCVILMKTIDPNLADQLNTGWTHAYKFHTEGWTRNSLTVEEVKLSMPHVIRFMDIVEHELNIDHTMATHLKQHLFSLDFEELAKTINKQAKTGEVNLLLHTLNMQKQSRMKLHEVYKQTYGEDFHTILVKNKKGFEQHYLL